MGSLQLRLFLTYLIIMMVTLGLFGVSLFLLLGGYRDSITYGSLEDVIGFVEFEANREAQRLDDLVDDADNPEPRDPVIADLLLALRTQFSSDDGSITDVTSVAVVDASGHVVEGGYASAFDLEGATVDNVEGPGDRPTGRTRRCRMEVPDSEPLLCVTRPLSPQVLEAFPDTPGVALVVAQPAASLTEVLDDLLPRLSFAALIGMAVALLLAVILSRSVAAPLRNIARAARNVARGNYRQRVPVTGPPEVRNLATDFNRMTEEVQRSEQTLRDFLMNISHELKTPLTSIRGFSNAILDGTIDDLEGIQRSAAVISDESDRVLRLVTELLDLSRIEAGQISMQFEELNVAELLDHVREVFAIRSEDAGVEFRVRTAACPPVRGDFDRLEQVMNNLLDNAFRHTPRGGLVEVAAGEVQAGRVHISVTNTGPGIPEDDLPHLFERFYRSERGNNPRGKSGYGLGLAISKEIVRAHGGRIWATSEPGGTTTFAFTLPSVAPAKRRAGSR
ncbi:MAG: hypothetical protein Kow0010_17580 [Dehalococcoidia bacterium]